MKRRMHHEKLEDGSRGSLVATEKQNEEVLRNEGEMATGSDERVPST
jgi:hypothetical protein